MSEVQLLTAAETQSERAESGRRGRRLLSSAAVYIGTGLLCIVAVCFVMELWNANLRIPLYTGHDANPIAMGVKNLVENGGWYTNKFVGAPGQLELYDFPYFYGFDHMLALKLLSLFCGNYAVVMNLYFLLSFPLAGATSLFVLRRLGISSPAAILASVLYALAPYHFLRGEYHYFLALYYIVPLAVLVVLWIGRGEPLFRFERADGEGFVTRKGAAAIAICALMTVDNVYYAFFAAWLMVVAAMLARFRHGRRGVVGGTAILLSVIGLTFAADMAPNFLFFHRHGHNSVAAVRLPEQSELFGLKMAQLIFPVTGHRLSAFADFKRDYNNTPLVNENDDASLGAIGSCGFILLMLWFFIGRGRSSAAQLLGMLSALNLAAFLLGTVGGLGTLFAWVVSPEIRSLNRISIFIAFFSLIAVALLADEVGHRVVGHHVQGRSGAMAWCGGLVLILALGVFDQTTEGFAPKHKALQQQFASDEEFVKRIEGAVPANAMILQLPYMAFPESAPIHKLYDYDHLLGYLHSRTLRWSYAAIRGRETDAWLKDVSGKPVDEMMNALVFAGFGGVYVDRFGYGDQAASLESQLRQALGVAPITSGDGRRLFFSLGPADARLRAKYTSAEWQARHDAALALPALSVTWEPSCWPMEGTPDDNWHWCPDHGRVFVSNRSAAAKKITFEMTLSTAYNEAEKMQIVAPGIIKEMAANADGMPIQLSLTVPPGESSYEFRHTPSDMKTMAFRVNNFRVRE